MKRSLTDEEVDDLLLDIGKMRSVMEDFGKKWIPVTNGACVRGFSQTSMILSAFEDFTASLENMRLSL